MDDESGESTEEDGRRIAKLLKTASRIMINDVQQ